MNADLAVVGLGTMGGRVAARAVEQGRVVVGWDPSSDARERADGTGVRVADAAECVAAAPVVVVSVPEPEHVRDLANDVLQRAQTGTVVVDLSTIDPHTARTAASALADHGVGYLDTPVLGRPEGVGNWTLVAGGPQELVDWVQPLLLETAAARVTRVGSVGAGSIVKLLNNLMFGAINAVTAEALALCRDNDVDPDVFSQTVAESGAATVSNLFRNLAPRIVSGDDDPIFAMDLLAKDNRLALELATESGTAAPIAATVSNLNQQTLDLGLGPRDSAAIYQTYQRDRSALGNANATQE